MKPHYRIPLSDKQIKTLEPLFEQARKDCATNRPGTIVAQLSNPEDGGELIAGYVDFKLANQLHVLLDGKKSLDEMPKKRGIKSCKRKIRQTRRGIYVRACFERR